MRDPFPSPPPIFCAPCFFFLPSLTREIFEQQAIAALLVTYIAVLLLGDLTIGHIEVTFVIAADPPPGAEATQTVAGQLFCETILPVQLSSK